MTMQNINPNGLHWMDWRNDLDLLRPLIPERLRGLPIEKWAASVGDRPAQNLALTLGLATVAFYLAERGKNPKCKDIFDALIYTTTCCSVGYGDIFARTPAGKVLGSLLMTVGPAMTGAALEGAKDDPDRPLALQQQILETLRAIHARLPEKAQE
jgi:hypothetical protein